MGVPIGEDVELQPGELWDLIYEVRDSVQFIEDLAIAKVKEDLAKDPRWHYQGSRWQTEEDDTFGTTSRFLIITVQVADPSKVTGQDPPDVQLAKVLDPRTLGRLIMFVSGSIAAVVVASKVSVIFRDARLVAIARDKTISDEVKVAAITGLTSNKLGDALKSFGRSLVIVTVLVSLLWLLSKSGLVERVRPSPAA